jgi:hypothetical protein
VGFLAAAYLAGTFIAATKHWGCYFTLLTVPIAVELVRNFKAKVGIIQKHSS